MLSPNPPPSVVESNGQNLPQPILNLTSNATLASGQTSSVAHQNSNNVLSNTSNFNNTSSTTPTTNVIINNIKTNTTTIGTTNLESGVVQPTATTATGTEAETTKKEEENCLRNRWHTCPELHKAMDGVTYIADHTKKEEESTRVSRRRVQKNLLSMEITFKSLSFCFSFFSDTLSSQIGERRLEICGDGTRSFIFMDFHDSCCCRHRRYHPASTHIIRQPNANRC